MDPLFICFIITIGFKAGFVSTDDDLQQYGELILAHVECGIHVTYDTSRDFIHLLHLVHRLGESLSQKIYELQMFRHGARTSMSTCPGILRAGKNDGYPVKLMEGYPEEPMQLTQRGKDESLELGRYLRERYVKFLPQTYSRRDILVRSADDDCNLVTAELVMYGLYPPLNNTGEREVFWQPTPVETVPQREDLLTPSGPLCLGHKRDLVRLQWTPEHLCLEAMVKHAKGYVEDSVGTDDLLLVNDCLRSLVYQGLPLPSWTNSVHVKSVAPYADMMSFFTYAGTKKIQRLYSGSFIRKLLSNMDFKLNGTLSPDTKLFVYSADDLNLISVLSTLGFRDAVTPQFLSCLIFELRRTTRNRDQYVVTVSYRNGTSKMQPLKLPGCSSVACTLEEFTTSLSVMTFDFDECIFSPPLSQLKSADLVIPVNGVPDHWKVCLDNASQDKQATDLRLPIQRLMSMT